MVTPVPLAGPGFARRLAALSLLAAAVLGCGDGFFHPPPAAPQAIVVQHQLSGSSAAYDRVDRIHVRVLHDGRTALDDILDFSPAIDETRIEVDVDDIRAGDRVDVSVELRRGGDALFRGAGSAVLQTGRNTPVEIPIDPVVAGVALRPATFPPFTAIGDTLEVEATAVFATGDAIDDAPLSWSSSAAAVVAVVAPGVLVATGEGEAEITAATGAFAASAIARVQPAVARVAVVPAAADVHRGDTLQLAATAYDSRDNVLAGRAVAWATSDATVATVDDVGTVVAQAESGTATITATVDGLSGTAVIRTSPQPVASVTVVPGAAELISGQSVQLDAILVDRHGELLEGRVIEWQSSDPSVATVSAAGLVVAQADTGTAVVTATSEGQAGTATITVIMRFVASLEIVPDTATLTAIDDAVQLTAIARDASGEVMDDVAVSWSSSAPAVASVDADGRVVAHSSPGVVTITAMGEGHSATATITVDQRAAVVDVVPGFLQMEPEQRAQLLAFVFDANGHFMPGAIVSWSSSDEGVVRVVDQSGLIEATGEGDAIVLATADSGASGGALVVVDYYAFATVAAPTGQPAAGGDVPASPRPPPRADGATGRD